MCRLFITLRSVELASRTSGAGRASCTCGTSSVVGWRGRRALVAASAAATCEDATKDAENEHQRDNLLNHSEHLHRLSPNGEFT